MLKMQPWLQISLLLCTFGFFRELRPSEPFVTEYLTGPWRNLTAETVNKQVYPMGTYAVLAQLVIVFLITDILRYKPIIILSACAGIVLFSILLWTKTILELQIGQVFYGTFNSCEVAYYTYIYAKVDKNRYQIVTGHTRAAILCGKFLGAVLAQTLVSTETLDYRGLHFISFGSQIVSLFISLVLPPVQRSLYFYTEKPVMDNNDSEPSVEGSTNLKAMEMEIRTNDYTATNNPLPAVKSLEPKFSWGHAISLLWQHIVSAYTNPNVIRWSCWFSIATCGQLQVISYVQFLWKEINESNISYYNGAVEATVTLLGAIGAMSAGLLNSKRHKKWHMSILTVCSLLMGAFLLISAVTKYIWIAYIMYISFGTVYFFNITIASATVAANLTDDSFGLIFGINTLVALIIQTILTVFVVTEPLGYGLGPRKQFLVYGGYFIALSVLYCFAGVINYFCKKTKK